MRAYECVVDSVHTRQAVVARQYRTVDDRYSAMICNAVELQIRLSQSHLLMKATKTRDDRRSSSMLLKSGKANRKNVKHNIDQKRETRHVSTCRVHKRSIRAKEAAMSNYVHPNFSHLLFHMQAPKGDHASPCKTPSVPNDVATPLCCNCILDLCIEEPLPRDGVREWMCLLSCYVHILRFLLHAQALGFLLLTGLEIFEGAESKGAADEKNGI
jgi:hypothetical protein